MTNVNFDKIERYIDGTANEAETKWVESLFLNGEENPTLRSLLEKDFVMMLQDKSVPDVDLSHSLDRIHHLIRKSEIKRRDSAAQKVIRIYTKIAAILLLPVLVLTGTGYWYFNRDTTESIEPVVVTTADRPVFSTIFAPLGSRVAFNLPDGSKGMLNSGSRLTYSQPFNTNRQIKMEGEGWFDINRDDHHPFEISTGNSTLRVLGTSFNISAYPSENYVEVVLRNGRVEFRDNNSSKIFTMLPKDRLVFQNGNIEKTTTDPDKYSAWTEGKLVFRGDLMAEVGRRLERWYNIKVELADKELEKYSFRGTFEDDKLEDVLHYLSMTSPISYKITPRRMLQNGSFEKEKVTIYHSEQH